MISNMANEEGDDWAFQFEFAQEENGIIKDGDSDQEEVEFFCAVGGDEFKEIVENAEAK
jgi:hypothetical protein